MAKLFLGLDLGGTNVKAGLADADGKLLGKLSMPTGSSPRDLTGKNVAARMVQAGQDLIAQVGARNSDVAAVGILSPGQASLARGIVFRAANFPLWRNVPIRDLVAKGLGIPGVLENDGNAAAYGEYWAGAGRGGKIRNLIIFTLGTGVGGGVVLEGQVIHGSCDFAAEVGHMIMIPDGELCGCGQRGCLEAYCSASSTGRRATGLLQTSRVSSSLRAVLQAQGQVTAADIAAHAKKGDAFARERWEESCKFIALAAINAIHWFDPQMIVLAGGMSLAGRFLLDGVKRHFKAQWWKMVPNSAALTLAQLGNDAGIIGAAGVAKNAYDRGALPRIGT